MLHWVSKKGRTTLFCTLFLLDTLYKWNLEKNMTIIYPYCREKLHIAECLKFGFLSRLFLLVLSCLMCVNRRSILKISLCKTISIWFSMNFKTLLFFIICKGTTVVFLFWTFKILMVTYTSMVLLNKSSTSCVWRNGKTVLCFCIYLYLYLYIITCTFCCWKSVQKVLYYHQVRFNPF